jgi:hypothetical protein
MPLGDIAETFLSLVVGCPEISWRLTYNFDADTFKFDDTEFKKELEGVSLTDPVVLGFLRGYLRKGIAEIQTTVQSF